LRGQKWGLDRAIQRVLLYDRVGKDFDCQPVRVCVTHFSSEQIGVPGCGLLQRGDIQQMRGPQQVFGHRVCHARQQGNFDAPLFTACRLLAITIADSECLCHRIRQQFGGQSLGISGCKRTAQKEQANDPTSLQGIDALLLCPLYIRRSGCFLGALLDSNAKRPDVCGFRSRSQSVSFPSLEYTVLPGSDATVAAQ
jgi:hypothetical protein